ncbi:Probable amino-acid metabolite efflux pump [Delftia tsuruhatensis]|uniref:DMT family transporter n=1 Tax=Delftia tsuruhatensis TaxID=180282 RepID=UPI001E6BFBDC|nr:DMT family transporter [Delftia tsuruhatensis]CAB5720351.1 Probable amino-acid metabolite efflux pump [Delftia tsuruhatensis]CAC9685750.1 Probable amino-acid metabolite efflux pump [Delftia tsuruhatensis]
MPTPTPQTPPAWLKAAPALFLLLWSSGFVVLKVGLAYADPMTFLALRYACVVALLLPLLLWLRPAMPRSASQWTSLAVIGLLLQAGYFCCTYLSLKLGMSAGGLALITSLQPILIGLLAPLIAHERVDARRWAGLALGVLGSALVIVSKASVDLLSPAGLLFAVAALLCITGGTLYEKRYGRPVHPVSSNFVQYGVALLVTAPLAVLLEPMHIAWTGPLLASLGYLVLCNSLVAITLLLAMIRHGEASKVSALFFLVPPCTAFIALLVLGEAIPPLAWPGMALAALGILLVTWRPGAAAP